MERPIMSVEMVSDGILVRFSDGMLTYFSHDFLRDHVGVGSNQVFLDTGSAADLRPFPPSLESLQQAN